MNEKRNSVDRLPKVRPSRNSLAPRFSLMKPPSLNSLISLQNSEQSAQNVLYHSNNPLRPSIQTQIKPKVMKILNQKGTLKKSKRKRIFKFLLYLYIYDKPSYEEISKMVVTDIKEKALIEMGFEEKKNTRERDNRVSFAPQAYLSGKNTRNSIYNKNNLAIDGERLKRSTLMGQSTQSSDTKSVDDLYNPANIERAPRQSSFLPRLSIYPNGSNFYIENQGTNRNSTLFIENEQNKFSRLNKQSTESLNHIAELPKLKTIGNVSINEQDVSFLRRSKFVNENLLNYFLLYLGEKQKTIDPVKIQKLKVRSLIFTTELMDNFKNKANRYDHYQFEYDAVRMYTSKYCASGKTIFDLFDIILIPFNENRGEFKLVVVDLNKFKIHIFDPLKLFNARDNKESALNGLFKLVVKFIESEQLERTKRIFNADWQFHEHDAPRIQNHSMSGLFVCFYAYHAMKGNMYAQDDSNNLEEFQQKLLGLLN
jgi:hypothetical protein